MKKNLIAIILALMVMSTANAQDIPKGMRMGIDGKLHPLVHSKKEFKEKNYHHEAAVKPTQISPPKYLVHNRTWVEDVAMPGLWYYGYYEQVGETYEFRYSRKEYKGALSNFRSLYHVNYKYELRSSNRSPVRVVYEYPY